MFFRSVRLGNSAATVSGATVGGGGPVLVLLVVPGPAVSLEREVKAPRTTHATSATTVSVMNAYDNATPARARSRPGSPVRRICASPRCPRIAPAGGNTNANTSDSVANALTGGCRGGAGGGATGGRSTGGSIGTRPRGS